MLKHAVILAIGNPNAQSRLTYNRSHVMLPALGKPLFIRIMERLYRAGIRQYTVIVGEAEGAVASYLNTQWMPDVDINLVIRMRTDNLITIFHNIAQQNGEPFLVCSYNSFTHTHFPERLIKQHESHPSALIFSGAPTDISASNRKAYAIVQGEKVLEIVGMPTGDTKNTLTLSDMFIAGHDMIDYLRQTKPPTTTTERLLQFIDLAYQYIQAGGDGIMARSTWILQVDVDRDLLALHKMLLDEEQDAHILSELPYTVKITPPVRIDPQVNVGQGSKIGPHVYLERGCSVGHDVVLRNSIVLTRVNVPAERTIVNTILTTRGPIT
jgi:NDP-sugar pyrophosphorylase family protein